LGDYNLFSVIPFDNYSQNLQKYVGDDLIKRLKENSVLILASSPDNTKIDLQVWVRGEFLVSKLSAKAIIQKYSKLILGGGNGSDVYAKAGGKDFTGVSKFIDAVEADLKTI
jgi:alanyl-tRNA synthetase